VRKASIILVLACAIHLLSTTAAPQTGRRGSSAQRANAARTADQIRAGRVRVSAQIKVLTHFLYLFGGIANNADLATPTGRATPRNDDTSSVALEQNQRSKAKVRDSIKDVRDGLDQLEAYFQTTPAVRKYYPYVAGLGNIGRTAESQAAANNFDGAGKSLLKAVDQLADALAGMR
jgi:hypothetical protein